MTIEFGILHNGFTDLPPYKNADGVPLPQGTLADALGAMQRIVLDQYRQGVLADQLGYDYWFLTEHHFQPEGTEFSPNPLAVECAVAVNTKRIRLGQMANIMPWHHPVRLAEQAAIVDVLSGGRLEFGIGRGYQSREAEVLGRPYGAGVQDAEANRAIFEEMYEIVLKCFTEESFSFKGDFFSIPPPYVNWHHEQSIAFYNQESIGRPEALQLGPKTGGRGLAAAATLLREITVGPQPLQKPYPQFWMPMSSRRSAVWAARNGVNGIYAASATDKIKEELDLYYGAAEEMGWPDRLGGGQFKFGWDSERKRGVAAVRVVHVVDGAVGDAEQMHRGQEMFWAYMAPFGMGAALTDGDDPMVAPTTYELARAEVNLIGSPQLIFDGLVRLKEAGGFEDMLVLLMFDGHGLPSAAVEEQMSYFSENLMPQLRQEYGARPDEPSLAPPPRKDWGPGF